jgi:SAM-dependent methyltransferase
MDLIDLITRTAVPRPWAEGEKIPWDEPAFSERMLREHLTQEHDLASRRFETIDAHVAWIHHNLLSGEPTQVLDLGCGPGLYASRLARLGHECVGIDFSPASVAYARDAAERDGLRCRYLLEDIRGASYGSGFDLVMLIFGEFNVFRPADARRILRKAFDALKPGGIVLLEPQTFEAVLAEGRRGTSWYSAPSGLFSDRPHLCLMEHFWDATACAATTRTFIVDTQGRVTPYAASSQAYSDEGYRALLAECGYVDVVFLPSLAGDVCEGQEELFVVVARKPA